MHSDWTSQSSVTSTGPSAPSSSLGSPLPSNDKLAPLTRSPSSLGELDLGPELQVDALVSSLAASGAYDAVSDKKPRAPDIITHSASAPLIGPLAAPPSLGRHARSDSDPTIIGHSQLTSPFRVVDHASKMLRRAEQSQDQPALLAVEAGDDGKMLDQQALEDIYGWQQDVWVTLRSEASPNPFYANPRTGDCSWEPPTGALVYVFTFPKPDPCGKRLLPSPAMQPAHRCRRTMVGINGPNAGRRLLLL